MDVRRKMVDGIKGKAKNEGPIHSERKRYGHFIIVNMKRSNLIYKDRMKLSFLWLSLSLSASSQPFLI